MAGPIGLLNVSRHTLQSMAQPKLIYKMDTSIATLAVNIESIMRSSRITVIRDTSWLFSEKISYKRNPLVILKNKATRLNVYLQPFLSE